MTIPRSLARTLIPAIVPSVGALLLLICDDTRAEAVPVAEPGGTTPAKGSVSGTNDLPAGEAPVDAGIADPTSFAPAEPAVIPAGRPDPALLRLQEALSLLSRGRAPEFSDLDALFSIPLDDPAAIKQRLAALPTEILRMEQRLAQLRQRAAAPESLVPPVERPAVLAALPVEPSRPEAPSPPEKPDRAEIRNYLKNRKSTDEPDPRARYQQALVQYEQDARGYQESLAAYEEAHAAFLERSDEYRQADEAYRKATEERHRRIASATAELSADIEEITQRLAVAELRRVYLSALSKLLDRLTEAGLEMFQSLKSPRITLRKRAETLETLSTEGESLLKRVRVLSHRAEAGSLLGFQVQREELSHNLGEAVLSLDGRLKKGRRLAGELLDLARAIESDSREKRRHILVSARSKELTRIMDQAFQTRLRESRRASRTATGFAVTDAELAQVRRRFASLLPRPQSIATVSDGEKALLEVRDLGESFDKILDAIPLGLNRHQQAYQRELVTLYSCLASPEVKHRAYSFSYAFLEDFVADLNLLRVDLSLWAENRLATLSKLSTHLKTLDGRLRVARVASGVLIILLFIATRRRIRRWTARRFLGLVNLRAFRHRAGLVVRLTVFGLALMPTLLTAASGYALLALIGTEYPETRVAEIAFRFAMIYFVGRQIVLGLTRREKSGRPPLFEMSAENAGLLRTTYARLGLFLAVVAAADEWSRDWLGTGSFNTMVRFVATGWLGVWLLWAVIAWRRPLAISAAAGAPEGSARRRIALFTRDHAAGVLLTPVLLIWMLLLSLFRASRRLLAEGHLLAYFRARALRRMSRKNRGEDSLVPALALPGRYTEQFPLYPLHGEEGEVLLPRRREMDKVLAQVAHWRADEQDGSLVLVGEKGIGKTTFLALLEQEISDLRVTRHLFAKKLRSEADLALDMGRALGMDTPSVDALARRFNEEAPRVFLLDEAHNIFLRTVGGFRAVDALVSLVDATSRNVFWVLVFNSYAWSFLRKANPHVRAFRKVLRLPPWSQDELKELVARRNDRSGLSVEFDEVLLDAETSSTGGFELIDSADGFFRLLWEASRGNPRVATYLWLNALTAVSDTRIRVGLIREENADFLAGLGTEMSFALASVAQHENLDFDELGRALNIPLDQAVHAARFLLEYGLLEPKHTDANRLTLAPRFHQQVIRMLGGRHLLYLEE